MEAWTEPGAEFTSSQVIAMRGHFLEAVSFEFGRLGSFDFGLSEGVTMSMAK